MIVLVGCASQKVLQATGGSRSDGVVNLSFETGAFESPVVDWNQANTVALKRCQAWGYTAAEAFGGSTSQCQLYNGYGNCLRAFVTVPYQCTNAYAEPSQAPVRSAPTSSPSYTEPAPVQDYTPPANAGVYVPQPATPAYAPAQPAPVYAPPATAPTNPPPATARAYSPPPVGAYNPDPYAIDPAPAPAAAPSSPTGENIPSWMAPL